jgi:hypothetical protein
MLQVQLQHHRKCVREKPEAKKISATMPALQGVRGGSWRETP